ncbi:Uncharacterised protein [Escherichia coli]|uniref:Uncharacterized protein n=1 Tax=Escherichia coli TaxID=562 RepID=A0A376NXC8_ECOLX|nr:Uncharacterised protein [Escherichia coli]
MYRCPVVIPFAIGISGETADVHIDEITAKEHPPVRIRRIHLQHGSVRFQIGVTTGAARTPVIVLEGDVKILLAIEVRRIAAHAAFQPVIFLVVTGQSGECVVILRTRRSHTGCRPWRLCRFPAPALDRPPALQTSHRRAAPSRFPSTVAEILPAGSTY